MDIPNLVCNGSSLGRSRMYSIIGGGVTSHLQVFLDCTRPFPVLTQESQITGVVDNDTYTTQASGPEKLHTGDGFREHVSVSRLP